MNRSRVPSRQASWYKECWAKLVKTQEMLIADQTQTRSERLLTVRDQGMTR
jgi:hypothetical protein